MQVTLLKDASREEDVELQTHAAGGPRRVVKGPSRWSDNAWDTIRRAVFVTIYVVALILSSTLVCTWITDAIRALRQDHMGQQFSLEAAMLSFHTYGVMYSMCMDVAVRENLMQTARGWKHEQVKFKTAVEASQAVVDAMAMHTNECKDALRQVHATLQASNAHLKCTTTADLLELETLNNAWAMRQPVSESWLLLETSNATRNGTMDGDVTTITEGHKAGLIRRLNESNLAMQRAVEMGADEANSRFDRMQQIATSLQDSLTFPSATNGLPIAMGQALQSTQESLREIKSMWTAMEPVLAMAGAKSVPPTLVLNEMDANLDMMIQVEQSWSRQLENLQRAINDTHVDAEHLREAVMVYSGDVSAELQLLSNDVNQSTGDIAAYSNWTIRTALLQQKRRPDGLYFPPLGMANWTNKSSHGNSSTPQSYGLDIHLEGIVLTVPIDMVGRVVVAIALAIKVWNKSYASIPHLDNQGITTIRTMADWLDVFRCRHSASSVLYSLSTIQLMPYFWAILVMTVCSGATFGFVVPVNRMHIRACSSLTSTDKAATSLGGFLVNLAAKHAQADGDVQAMEGYAQLQSIHDRTCTTYQHQLDALNGAAVANASVWMDDYSHLHALVKLFGQCNRSTSTATTNASMLGMCGVQPAILRERIVAANWACPPKNWTLESIKAPCTMALTQEFKDTEGKAHGCALERRILETVAMWWVWLVLLGMLNLMRLVLMKIVAMTLWRALSGGRMPFVGFVGDDGAVLDQNQLTYRFERQLDEYILLGRLHAICAAIVFAIGVALIAATLSSLA
ncbi:hypothetical protein H310_01076 [Aphanomyces invadans]|uniref:Uncharacterized protein n=1 Tax=Aphanomyces invadans TaxID=157072 RepID=A0A024UQ06_9STRA|nr:hypothetical protein H310_01076 [Aphanomyces invadans]ETW08511.1 hypothetical protein H310_01076 [Aphanomyces invadans]|eukprot:XP_008862316.1 hypothetical protein H310_01076 [Aphanomyces invadans]